MAMTEEERREKHKEYCRRWNHRNKEKQRERRKVYAREYYERNKEKIKARHREYYQKNRDYFLEYNKKHYQENKEKYKEYEYARRQFVKETKDNVYLLIDKNTDEVVRKITIKELAKEQGISYMKAYTFLRDSIEYDGCYISEE